MPGWSTTGWLTDILPLLECNGLLSGVNMFSSLKSGIDHG